MLSPAPGYALYVEPSTFVPSGDELLLAGAPAYLFRREPDSTTSLVTRDSVFGAVMRPDGKARLVPFPFTPVPISDVRALPRAGGGWTVAFAELPRSDSVPNEGPIARLWQGVFKGRTWSSIVQLPIPSDLRLRPLTASSLARAGDTLLWAFPYTNAKGDRGISLYVRRGREWTQETVPLRGAAYAEVGGSDSLGVVLIAVHPDTALRRDENSLFLHSQRAGWRQIRKLAAGAREPVHYPQLALDVSPGALTWHVIVTDGDRPRWEARAMVGRPDLRNEPVVVLDSSVARGSAYVQLDARHIWLFDHVDHEGKRQLRVVTATTAGALQLGQLPYPYDGTFTAAAVASNEILLAGPSRGEPPRDPGVATLLSRVRLECSGRVR